MEFNSGVKGLMSDVLNQLRPKLKNMTFNCKQWSLIYPITDCWRI